MLDVLLGSKAEAKTLGVVLFKDSLYLREVARQAEISPSEAKRELDKLVSVGLLNSTMKGNLRLFTVNQKCPFLSELRALYMKTDGIFRLLSEALGKVGVIEYAFVYGSTARDSHRENSDIDIMIIGKVDEHKLEEEMFAIQKKTDRELNYILWTPSEFRQKVSKRGAFVKSVMTNKKVWLKGDEEGFKRTVEKGHNRKN
ncbi:nucleotidyltransferase domain-containing protein [archaeon]|nr:nucleotidyltransferase domain-containing protein [archaeon]